MNSSSMHMAQNNVHGVRVLTLSGRLDPPGAAAVMKAITRCRDTEPQAVLFDLADLVEPVEPHVLLIFPAAQRRIGRWPEREVRLAEASAPVTQELHRLDIDRFVTIDDTLLGALEQLHAEQGAVRRTHCLVPVQSSPCQARHCVDDLLASAPADCRATARLVTSELVTNALRHVRDQFTLSLALTDDDLLIAVTDADCHIPTLGPLDPSAEGGRGLHLVESLSTCWGVRPIYKGGKTVWSRIATAA
jgi:anti-anti-sigma regulatory factor